MAACEVCGNEYARPITVQVGSEPGRSFDSFECAIHALAPVCEHCGVKIVGHGIEASDRVFCCASCARNAGVEGAQDHV